MKIFVTTFVIIILFLTESYSQAKFDSAIDDVECFLSVMKIGAKTGYWDSTLIKPDTTLCVEYFNQRVFSVTNDTLIIVKKVDTLYTDFVGIKTVIQSDSLIFGYFYLPQIIEPKGKLARRMKKEPQTNNSGPLKFKVRVLGDTCRIDFGHD